MSNLNEPVYIVTQQSISVQYQDSSPKKLFRDDSPGRYDRALEAILGKNFEDLLKVFDVEKALRETKTENISVEEGIVYYKGEALPEILSQKLMSLYDHGDVDISKYEQFVEKIMQNPSRRSQHELYTFLAQKELPILEDGRFLAYKGVTSTYKDCHSNTYDNKIGKVNTMERNKVDDDYQHGCSYGFHVGSYEYAKGFKPQNGHLMFVAVNPAMVVSVPSDCGCQKCRVSEYEVIGEDKELIELERPIYERDGEGEYQFDNSQLEYDEEDEKLDKLLVESLTEHFHMKGIIPTISQISEASRINDTEEVLELLEDLGYSIDDEDDEIGSLRVYEK